MDEELTIRYDEGKRDGEIVRLLCSHCKSKNNHTIVHSSNQYVEVDGMWFNTDYCVVRCNGCDRQSFCEIAISSEDMPDHVYNRKTGKYEEVQVEKHRQHPAVNINYTEPASYFSTPFELLQICNETFAALGENSAKLASVGMRVIIETTCALHDISDEQARTLPEKIKLLRERQVISQGIEGILLSVKDFGDIGAHTLRTPKKEELVIAWGTINIMISSIYGTEDTKNSIVSMKGFRKDGKAPKHEPF